MLANTLALVPSARREAVRLLLLSADCHWLLLDNGACVHACPLDYAQHVPLQPVGPGVRVCAVNGESIKVLGVRTVRILLWGIQPADVTFHVMAISRPLLSDGLLRQMGFDLHL
eukprot:1538311-Heterocapsa_arctica.AAC.1